MRKVIAIVTLLALTGCVTQSTGVGHQRTTAQFVDGMFISWREHLIDDVTLTGVAISGSDGLVMGDVDGDGFEDIVSVHESDTTYDGMPDGHVRLAFGSDNPDQWTNITLADGTEAGAPEDAVIADINQDGLPDVAVAAELAHIIYLQNPGRSAREESWPRLILPMTQNRGSWLRVFAADFNGDGRLELVAPNKGAQNPVGANFETKTSISIFAVDGDPLQAENWHEQALGNYSVPHNAHPVDLDGDGDIDVVGGIRGSSRLVFLENRTENKFAFVERPIKIEGAMANGFHMVFADLNGDDRLDIVTVAGIPNDWAAWSWLEQPADLTKPWIFHRIGDLLPDMMTGVDAADIDGDGDLDVISGGYSRGSRSEDSDVDVAKPMGRIAWFQNPGIIGEAWTRHDISRRQRGMFDMFVARDLDKDGDVDFVSTRGNSGPYDGVFWLEQVRTKRSLPVFDRARKSDSPEMPLSEQHFSKDYQVSGISRKDR